MKEIPRAEEGGAGSGWVLAVHSWSSLCPPLEVSGQCFYFLKSHIGPTTEKGANVAETAELMERISVVSG